MQVAGAITKGREGKEMAAIAGLVGAGVKIITDDGAAVENPQMLASCDGVCSGVRADRRLALRDGGALWAGGDERGQGILQARHPRHAAMSEEICIERDIAIARHTGCRLHIQHVTTARGLEIIRRAKEDGVDVSCEVTPHHLIFNEEDIVDYDANFKMNPPLRTVEDSAALLAGLYEGIIDVIATDHAPHTEFEKCQQDFASAPFGITGLETALPSLYQYFVEPGKLDWGVLVERYSAKPREMLGMESVEIVEGDCVELVVFDPEAKSCFTKEFMCSKASNTPFLDKELSGSVDRVLVGDSMLKP